MSGRPRDLASGTVAIRGARCASPSLNKKRRCYGIKAGEKAEGPTTSPALPPRERTQKNLRGTSEQFNAANAPPGAPGPAKRKGWRS